MTADEFTRGSRRSFLKYGTAIGAAGMFGLAGCIGGDGGDGGDGDGGDGPGDGGDGGDTVTLTISDHWPEHHLVHEAMVLPFKEKVVEKTDGQVQWDAYHAGELHAANEGLDMLQGGATDITNTPPVFFQDRLPLGEVGYLPALFADNVHGSVALYELHQNELWEMEFRDQGIKSLLPVIMPTYQLFTSEEVGEVTALEDWDGLTLRGAGTLALGPEKLGAATEDLPTSDVYQALESGIVDGTTSGYSTAAAYDWYTEAPYGTKPGNLNLGGFNIGYWISVDVFDGLPADIQDAIEEAGQETVQEAAQTLFDGEVGFMEQFEDEEDFTAYEVPDDELSIWEEELAEVGDEWATQVEGGEEVLEAFRGYIDDVDVRAQ